MRDSLAAREPISERDADSLLDQLETLAGSLSAAGIRHIRLSQPAGDGGVERNPDPALDRIARLAAAAVRAPASVITLRHGGRSLLASVHGNFVPPDQGPALDSRVLETNATLVLRDLAGVPGAERMGRARFYAGAPARGTGGEIAAVLSVVDFQPRPDWGPRETSLLEDAAASLESEFTLRSDVFHVSWALLDSEANYRQFYDSIPVGVYRRAADGRIVTANQALAEMLGFPGPAELIEARDFSFRADEDRETLRARLLAEGEVRGVESRWRRRDGSQFYVRETARVALNRKGEVRYWEGVAEDITEAKRIREALKDTEARFQAFMDHVPATAFFKDRSNRALYVNPAFHEVFGTRPEQILGKTSEEIFPPDVAARVRADDEAVLTSGEPTRILETFPLPGGEPSHWLTTKFSFTGGSGETLLGGIAIDITDRTRAEQALRESQERLSLSQSIAHIASWEWNLRTGDLSFDSDKDSLLMGTLNVPSSMREWLDCIHPDDRAGVEVAMRQALESDESGSAEYRLMLPGAPVHWLSTMGKVIGRDESGNPLRVIGITQNITRRRQAEAALRASEARFNAFMDHLPAAAFIKDRAGRRVYINARHRLEIGPAADKWVDKTVEELFPPETAARLRAFDEELFATGRTSQSVERFLLEGVGLRDLLIVKFPFRSEDGALLMGGVAVDITDRLRVEEALRESEERFRVVAETSNDFIMDWNLDTGELTLYGAREVLPPIRTFEELNAFTHPDDRARAGEAMERAIREGGSVDIQFRGCAPDGSIYHMHHRGAVVRDSSGRPYRYIGGTADITARKRAEEEIARLAALVQSSGDAIIALSLDGEIQSWNSGAAQLLRYSSTEAVGRPWTTLAPAQRKAAFEHMIHEARSGRPLPGRQINLRRSDGGKAPVSLSLAPIRSGSGEIIGISAIARDVTERKRAERELARQAHYDQLTGLPNRRALNEWLEREIADAGARGKLMALIYFDLDGFKLINDTFGHAVGDALLRAAALRFEGRLREGDMLARMGGDEFTLLARDLESPDAASQAARRILECLEEPFAIGGKKLYASASVGISLYPIHAGDAVSLQQQADAAMYEAKRAGKNRVRFYMPQIGYALRERMDLGNELRSALDRGELKVEYQPLFLLSEFRVTGLEALLRWHHPKLGSVAPSKFIPIAEETGLIQPIGEWVIQRVCRDMRRRADAGRPPLRVAINVSAAQFMAADFADRVQGLMTEARVAPEQIELELTESCVLASFEDAVAKMCDLRAFGIKFALDDFGTGFSSLSYLQRLPIDALKIDRSFTAGIGREPRSLRLIQAIVSLAHGLGLRVVIEGLETRAQFEAARNMACDEGQGYLLGCPGPGEYWIME